MIMENKNNIIWETKDYKDRNVVLRADERQHIYDHHGAMKNGDNLYMLKGVVESPDVVYQSAEYPTREIYISKSTEFTYSQKIKLTKVVVQYDSAHSGRVVTAFPTKKVGGKLDNKLYPEDDV